MTVNYEIKGMLARLLATEDLIVEHKKVETACFNVQTRVLTLPMWEKASNNVYDLLLSHEAAHAIFTDNIDWTEKCNIPKSFVNIVEDARIEKIMKRRYAGLAKTFYNGYKELNEQDFFCIGDDDLETYNLADRSNLFFKVGNFVDVPIKEGRESEIINKIADTETFDDVLIVAKELYEYCKENQNEDLQSLLDDLDCDENNPNQSSSSDSGTDSKNEGNNESDDSQLSESSSNESLKKSNENDSESNHPENNSSSGLSGSSKTDNEPKCKTMESLEKSLKQLINQSSFENTYLELPKVDLDKVIISNKEIHSSIKNHFSNSSNQSSIEQMDREFLEFKRSAQKEVNYLVKEFECRKAADSYSRSTVSSTGVLDCSKLHTYKYNEDLFKKVATIAEGKNHGLVFILDWSGSMGKVMLDTIKQLFNLIWFCKKVSIPFEVYAFTCEYPVVSYDSDGKVCMRELSYDKKDGTIQITEFFSLMNFLTSEVSGKNIEEQMKNIFRLVCSLNYYYGTCPPTGMDLSGTPLNESLVCLHEILPKFQQKNKLQKVQCVILTDGEGHSLKYHREVQRKWENEPFLGTSHISPYNSFIRDRKTGMVYSLKEEDLSDVLLRNLRDKFKNINFIGIRVLESSAASGFIRKYCGYVGDQYNKVFTSWKRERAFTLKNSGYHAYFGISSNSLSQKTDFEVAECATKSQIKSAFMKSLKSKKMNKKILGEFIELVV